ncbi:MAG: hypothetical protein V4598_19400 [Bdellovibrionota bacterium]
MKAISLLILVMACSSHQPDAIKQQMLDKYPEYHPCYAQSETFKKNEKRSFMMSFTINADGSTSGHKLYDQVGFDRKMDECFLGVMRNLHYKQTDGKTINVTQPFNFYP